MARHRLLEWAIAYVEKCGVPVFPVHGINGNACDCGKPDCSSPGKHPLTEHGLKDATADPGQIRIWWAQWPNANIGMPTGEASYYWVLDVDLPEGEKSLAKIIRDDGLLPDTAVSVTGSGGRQFFFAYPSDTIRNTASAVAEDLDVRGEGGYVVLPPSNHVSGRAYQWEKGAGLWQRMLVEAPKSLVCRAIEASKAAASNGHMNGSEPLAGAVPAGKRNDVMFRTARSLKKKRLSRDGVYAALLAENRAKCQPPLTDAEIGKIVDNAFKLPDRADFAEQAGREEKTILSVDDPMAIARQWSNDLIEPQEGRILHRWDEKFWQWSGAHYREVIEEDVRAELWRYSRDRVILLNAKQQPIKPSQAIVSDVFSALKAHINIPRHLADPPSWLDRRRVHVDIVPVANGLLNLRTRKLEPCSPRFFNLHHCAAAYQPEATSPAWLTFLDSIWGSDPEQVETLQEMFGYLLAERMEQQKMFMIIGPPRSGKGTIGNVIEALLGDDAVARPPSSEFTISFGTESLIGRSLAIMSDARIGGKDNELLVEILLSISGQDSIDVRRKYRGAWRGKLRTRFLLLSNELPKLWDAAQALPNRFVIFVTRLSFLGQEDYTIIGRIKDELPGVLNWALDGYDRLYKRGYFKQPASAEELLDQFKILSSPLTEFVGVCCELVEGAECPLSTLYQAYLDWCEQEHNKFPLNKNFFARDLRASQVGLSYARITDDSGRKIRIIGGLRLRAGISRQAEAFDQERSW